MSSPLHVGWVAGKDTLDSLAPMLNPLAVGLMDELVELTLLCPRQADLGELSGPPTEIVRYSPSFWPLRCVGTRAILAEPDARKPDLLHALDFSAAGLTRRLARRANLPYVVSSFSLADTRRLGRADARLGAVLAGSEKIELGIIKHHVAAAAKVHRVPPALHVAKRPRCFRDPTHSVAVVAACRLRRWKVLLALAGAFGELKKRGYDCVFMIIGSGGQERRLRKLADQAGLQRDLTFADKQSGVQLGKIIMAADIFVSPDPGPGIDLGGLMAMASGVPLLAGRDTEDFITDGQTALVFDPTSGRDLTDKLSGLLDDRAAARALAENALEHCREQHRPSAMVSTVAGLYRQVVAEFKSHRR